MSDATWYVVGDDGERGPMSGEKLKALARAGGIVAETRVRREDLRMAVPASQVAGLLPDEPPAPDTDGTPDTDSTPLDDAHPPATAETWTEPTPTLADRAFAAPPRRIARASRVCLWIYAFVLVANGLIIGGTPAGAAIAGWAMRLLPLMVMTMLPMLAVMLLVVPLFVAWLIFSYRLLPAFEGRSRHAWHVALWAWILPIVNVVVFVRMLTDLRRTFGSPGPGLVAAWGLVGMTSAGLSVAAVQVTGLDAPQPMAIRAILAGTAGALTAILIGETTKAQTAAVESARRSRMLGR